MSQRLKEFPIRLLDRVGVIKDQPVELIPDAGWQSGRNVRFNNGRILTMPGWAKLAADALASGRVMHGDQYTQRDSDRFLLVFTKTKVYRYVPSTQTFSDISGAFSFAGGNGDLFSSDTAYDTFLMTNSVDVVKKWTGSGDIATLGGMTDCEPGGISVKCKIIRSFADFVVALNTTEDGSAFSQRVRWNKRGVLEVWKNDSAGAGQAGYTDISDTPGQIYNASKIGNSLAIYKEDGIWLMSYVGLPAIFAFRGVVSGRGLIAPRALANLGDVHIFIAQDNIYLFNGASAQPIGNAVKDFFYSDLNAGFKDRIATIILRDLNEVWFAYPSTSSTGDLDKILTYNYKTGAFSFADIAGTCLFSFLQGTDITWETIPDTTWDDAAGAWDDFTLAANFPAILFGTNDGYVMRVGNVYSVNGVAYTKQVISKLYDFGLAQEKRLQRIYFAADSDAIANVRVYVGTAKNPFDTITWNGPYTITNLGYEAPKIDLDLSDYFFAFRFESVGTGDPWGISQFMPCFIPR